MAIDRSQTAVKGVNILKLRFDYPLAFLVDVTPEFFITRRLDCDRGQTFGETFRILKFRLDYNLALQVDKSVTRILARLEKQGPAFLRILGLDRKAAR